jgi:hypothetical protein
VLAVPVASACKGRSAAPSPRDGSLKEVLQPKVQAEWDAFKSKDAVGYGSLLADDFIAVEVDSAGTRNRSEAIQEIATSRVSDVLLSRFDARPLGGDAAMLTYEASLSFSPPASVRFLRVYVTEIWIRRGGEWKAIHYQETRVK